MGPLSYMQFVVDRNVVKRRITVLLVTEEFAVDLDSCLRLGKPNVPYL